jgi:Ran GTPase-activating protein (RanGAP) involved in mRNA processing and transport
VDAIAQDFIEMRRAQSPNNRST